MCTNLTFKFLIVCSHIVYGISCNGIISVLLNSRSSGSMTFIDISLCMRIDNSLGGPSTHIQVCPQRIIRGLGLGLENKER